MCIGVSWCALSFPRPFRRKKGGVWNCLHPFVHPFVHSSARPFVWTKFCGCRTQQPLGRFLSKSSSLEPSWPVDVQRHAYLPVGSLDPCSQGGGPPMICFYLHGLTLIPAWINNDIHYKVWDEITYPFLNFNGIAAEVWEWISNFTLHFTEFVITYPCLDSS